MLITVINNLISFLITIAIVFVAPLMIAYAGFLFVVNPVNAGGISQAKTILTNTIIGIVIALAGYLIVGALMAVLYNPSALQGKAWDEIINWGGPACLPQAGVTSRPPDVSPGVEVACSIQPLPPITDALAQQMENGQTVIWGSTDARLQPCVNKFIGIVGGTVTSAYRPQAYQDHLYAIRDRWCTQELKTNSTASCSALKSAVSAEVSKHFGYSWSCGAVAQTSSNHGGGTGVDISGISHSSASVQAAASQSCLQWANYSGDPYHYNLKSNCSCN